MSVVVPAYNEGLRIAGSLNKIRAYMDHIGLDFEIIVVDDGSKDATSDVVAALASDDSRIRLLANSRNMGKGYSVRRGMQAAQGDVVLFSDADLSTPIEEFEKLLPHLETFDIVIASRSLPGSDVVVHQPAYRELMGRIFNLIVRALLIRGIIDTQCGFKLMTRKAAHDICRFQRINSFSFDVEMILIARRLGFGVKDVPVRWVDSKGSRVHPIWDSAHMLLDLLRIKIYDVLGFYEKTS